MFGDARYDVKYSNTHSSIKKGSIRRRMNHPSPLLPGILYHIYNRGVNGETLFYDQRNYAYFINLYVKYIQPVADTYSFCLLPNHFHLAVEVKDQGEKTASQAFSNLFNAYSKAFNLEHQRTGPLFERPFKRIPVTDSSYFSRLLIYIHQNPQKHGLIDDFRRWPYSSYAILSGDQPTFIKRDVVTAWYGDINELLAAHESGLMASFPGKDTEDF